VDDHRTAADHIGGTGTLTYAYDALGRVTQVTDQDGYVVAYGYRGDGQRSWVRVSEPSAGQVLYDVTYGYDAAGRLTDVNEPLRGPETPRIARLGYDANGNRSRLTYWLDGTLGGAACKSVRAADRHLDHTSQGSFICIQGDGLLFHNRGCSAGDGDRHRRATRSRVVRAMGVVGGRGESRIKM